MANGSRQIGSVKNDEKNVLFTPFSGTLYASGFPFYQNKNRQKDGKRQMINRTMFRNRGRAMAFAFALAASAALSACGGGAKQETTKAAESGETQSAPASAEKGAENGPGAGSGS